MTLKIIFGLELHLKFSREETNTSKENHLSHFGVNHTKYTNRKSQILLTCGPPKPLNAVFEGVLVLHM